MKISIFTHMTNPEERMDPWREALECYEYFCDEVLIVGENWPYEFDWKEIGQNFQEGFEKADGDWVINMPLDFFFHEKSRDKLVYALKKYNDAPAIAIPKFKFFSPTKYEFKNFEIFVLNKKKFPSIRLNGGGDLCLATLDGKLIEYKDVPVVNIPIWNYDTTFRTKEIIAEDRARFARAWYRHFNEWGDRGGPKPDEAFDAWFHMIKNRLPRHINKIKIESHPMFVQDILANLKEDQFGFDCFGLLNSVKPTPQIYFDYLKLKYKFPNIKLNS